MLFHYALVDDLITKEEFERRVEKKIDECGDLVDEPTAAMMVVGELGREHVKIKGLLAKSSLFSFFGKILDKTEPKEFDRADGEKGWVATLLLGDETGTTRVVLWDEKAGAVLDTTIGDVLEVIGRHPPQRSQEIYALALRKASCEITCTVPAAGGLSTEPVALDAVLLAVDPPRTFTKRDGSTGEMAEAVIGDREGTARLVAWVPELLAGLMPGTGVHIINAKPTGRGEGRNYSIDEKSTVTVTTQEITIPVTPLESVGDSGIYSVRGMVRNTREPRSFTARSGGTSWVRNIVIGDATGELRLVLWGDHALVPVETGTVVEAYHATAKPGKYGGIELGVGRGSVLRVPAAEASPISFTGTIIQGPGCLFIDNGRERYIIGGEFEPGTDVRVTGTVSGSRILADSAETIAISREEVLDEIRRFRKSLAH